MNTIDLEIEVFIEVMKKLHGYDFSSYAQASLKRRVLELQSKSKSQHISSMVEKLIHDEAFLNFALSILTVSVSELFRDPSLFKNLREEVVPYLATFSQINIWIAGCASGEEAYSLAILLHEEGLLQRTQIYASDICPIALSVAQSGVLRETLSAEDALHYQEAGGKTSLSEYFTTLHGFSKIKDEYLSHILFQNHNMVEEPSFISPHLLMCRNVFIYFNKDLQDRVLHKFTHSIDDAGFLVLGAKENLHFSSQYKHYKTVNEQDNIYQKRNYD